MQVAVPWDPTDAVQSWRPRESVKVTVPVGVSAFPLPAGVTMALTWSGWPAAHGFDGPQSGTVATVVIVAWFCLTTWPYGAEVLSDPR